MEREVGAGGGRQTNFFCLWPNHDEEIIRLIIMTHITKLKHMLRFVFILFLLGFSPNYHDECTQQDYYFESTTLPSSFVASWLYCAPYLMELLCSYTVTWYR